MYNIDIKRIPHTKYDPLDFIENVRYCIEFDVPLGFEGFMKEINDSLPYIIKTSSKPKKNRDKFLLLDEKGKYEYCKKEVINLVLKQIKLKMLTEKY